MFVFFCFLVEVEEGNYIFSYDVSYYIFCCIEYTSDYLFSDSGATSKQL